MAEMTDGCTNSRDAIDNVSLEILSNDANRATEESSVANKVHTVGEATEAKCDV